MIPDNKTIDSIHNIRERTQGTKDLIFMLDSMKSIQT